MENRQVKRIPKQEIDRRENIRRRAEIGLMEVYLIEMAAKYPDQFKRLYAKARAKFT
jgi:hypothetical protein